MSWHLRTVKQNGDQKTGLLKFTNFSLIKPIFTNYESAVALLVCFCTQICCENGCSSDTESSEFTELYLYTRLSTSWPWHGPGLYLRAMMTVNRSRSG
jgi:hypothetical protein